MTNTEKAAALAEKIDRQVRKSAGKGLNAARTFIEGRIKETASVKAPTRTSASGRVYATTPATPGAPLRVVTGDFWEHITSQMVSETEALVGTSAHAERAIGRAYAIIASVHGMTQEAGFNYPAFHEVTGYGGYSGSGQHQTFQPTFEQYADQMGTIVGGEIKTELS